MQVSPESPIHYEEPDLKTLRESGFRLADMHLHTNHSDGLTRIPDLVRYAKSRDIGVAITDHNEISGVLSAVSCQQDVQIIPGIELETKEGPHLLFYFYTAGDLEDFFNAFCRERQRETPGMFRNLPVAECLYLAESYDCLKVAAHPFGYFGINRGVLKCVEKNMLPGVLTHLDGIEVICGGMMKDLNMKAISYAEDHKIPFTGGSDAHLLADVGSVVTGVPGDTDEFLAAIHQRKNIVVGKPGSYLNKGMTAGVIAWSFVPYTTSQILTRYQYHRKQTTDLLSKMRDQIPSFPNHKKEESEKSEERGEESGY
ncbi:MAG: PHP domain-containing protein [Methanospirillum sp.]|uniref:PHP domain-containing protein n=1 Tax=Methanospirillum sp. TaxID=45200 RepID=UPI00236E88ED|nr:PHP domain-containing protein [Methanospirillum sp.]MDD1728949.1 PHP domain-containing protein [Methanospirillum sp.]